MLSDFRQLLKQVSVRFWLLFCKFWVYISLWCFFFPFSVKAQKWLKHWCLKALEPFFSILKILAKSPQTLILCGFRGLFAIVTIFAIFPFSVKREKCHKPSVYAGLRHFFDFMIFCKISRKPSVYAGSEGFLIVRLLYANLTWLSRTCWHFWHLVVFRLKETNSICSPQSWQNTMLSSRFLRRFSFMTSLKHIINIFLRTVCLFNYLTLKF